VSSRSVPHMVRGWYITKVLPRMWEFAVHSDKWDTLIRSEKNYLKFHNRQDLAIGKWRPIQIGVELIHIPRSEYSRPCRDTRPPPSLPCHLPRSVVQIWPPLHIIKTLHKNSCLWRFWAKSITMIDFSSGSFMLPLRIVQLISSVIGMDLSWKLCNR
jgi:hypothetical protein